MGEVVEQLTRGNVAEVKVVLASVVTALALYQVALMVVGYGKIRLPFLDPKAASTAHRASGDTIVGITLLVALACLAYFGFEGDHHGGGAGEDASTFHVVSGFALLGALALKVAVVRWWHSMSRWLPVIGVIVLTLFVVTWLSSAGRYLWER